VSFSFLIFFASSVPGVSLTMRLSVRALSNPFSRPKARALLVHSQYLSLFLSKGINFTLVKYVALVIMIAAYLKNRL
jgi:hypothetical protein